MVQKEILAAICASLVYMILFGVISYAREELHIIDNVLAGLVFGVAFFIVHKVLVPSKEA